MTQYLYGNLSNPFQVTASRAPDNTNTLTVYYYDDFGALYALERGGVRYYVGSDHLGTPKMVTDNTGAIIKMYEYDSWGNKTVLADNDPTLDLPVGFAGGIPDDATGLVRFGFRDYEPGTGRWTAKDPIFFRGGQYNLFVYIGNDPLNFKDPSGLRNWVQVGKGGWQLIEGFGFFSYPFVVGGLAYGVGGPVGAGVAGAAVSPVAIMGYIETKHGLKNIVEGLKDPVDLNDVGGSCPSP